MHISFVFLCSAHISVVIPTAEKASLLRRVPPNVAIPTPRHCVALATFGGSCRNSDALGHNVAIATSSSKCRNCDTFLSVGITTLFYKRRYSDGFRRDGKNLGKFPTFGQKHRNQVSEFSPNVVVMVHMGGNIRKF